MSSIAQTRHGQVEGVQQDDLVVFRGIPYAAPPVGQGEAMKEFHAGDFLRDLVDACVSSERDGKQLPVGVQLMGKWWDEQNLLNIASGLEM